MMPIKEKPNDYGSVQKALQILLAFTPLNNPLGTTEISARLGLNKSTVSRLLNVLTSYDFLQQDENTKKFKLGSASAQLSLAIKRSLREQMIGLAQPFLDDLRNEIGEAVALEIWVGDATVMAYRAEALKLRRAYILRPGDKIDVHVSAGARIIMAYLAPQVVDGILQEPFKRYTENTIIDADRLKEKIRQAGDEGFVISKSERNLDSNIIAVPVFNYEKKPVAALSLFTNDEEMPKLLNNDIIAKLKDAAARISAKLLYDGEE